ncbi:MAG: enoyl-CoA hydratase/isomerase family protein [Rhodothermales bacterium]|nr:enoyl-CoA hydratase/isomerase family protein [Rhodothermales bacterium]MBO6780114.1 enoyl-CoA hydratase/isomerase family protein [Rhodothermales bacterium]
MEATLTESVTRAHRPFRKAAVLGAGTMGAQIAAHFVNAGMEVLLLDIPAKEGRANDVVQGAFKRATKLKPAPFFRDADAGRVQLGNFDDDMHRLADMDWVVEAVVERMDIKRSVMARVAEAVGPDTVVSTNTSGLPIADIAEGLPEDFRRRFLGTHFFNPPRYLRLLEVIPTPDTDPDVLARVSNFGRVHLGKGIVIAKDRPYFIGNRIGIYAMLGAIRAFVEDGYSIEEIDALTGTLVGHPKSATFRTADVVGLDVMKHVIENLYETVPHDERREAFRVPKVLETLVGSGALGAKTRAGFYKKEGSDIKSIHPASGEYELAREFNLGDIGALKGAGDLTARLNALYEDQGRAGAFFRKSTLDLLAYTARRIPEISDSPADVDRAVCWGFGWRMGPFAMWDALGFERIRADLETGGEELPGWISEVASEGFYGDGTVFLPGKGYQPLESPEDEKGLAAIKSEGPGVVWQNADTQLIDMGDGVVCLEFRSKANSLGQFVMEGVRDAIDRVEADRDIRGLVIGNEGSNFSVGANLGEAAMAVMMGQMDTVEQFVAGFQETIQRIRYAEKPVVVAVHQRVLGGACEMVMASPQPVAAAESYVGLVELGVGLIPAGTGTMRLAQLAAERSPNGFDSEIQAFLQVYFENVAMARVATSAAQAMDMSYLAPNTQVVMNAERRFHVAKSEVVRLSEAGYMPPPRNRTIRVLGRPAGAAMQTAAYQFLQGRFISEYDFHLAERFGYVLTGGALTGPQDVTEAYLIDLEREVFMGLLGEEKTMARIQHILTHNKPLRN